MEKKNFLLADDDRDDRDLFREALTGIDKNIVCHFAEDGSEALEKINSLAEKPHLIFLDINMPGMNGWQCLTALKKDERYNNIPVIIISTSSHLRDMQIARDLGALCYLVKPNDFNELKDALQIILTGVIEGRMDLFQNSLEGSPYINSFIK